MKGKEKLIGGIIVIVLGAAGAFFGFSSDSFKAGFCEGYVAPVASPSPEVSIVPVGAK